IILIEVLAHFAVDQAEGDGVLLAVRDRSVVTPAACDLLIHAIDIIRTPVESKVDIQAFITARFPPIYSLVGHEVQEIVARALDERDRVHKISQVITGTDFVFAWIRLAGWKRTIEVRRAVQITNF